MKEVVSKGSKYTSSVTKSIKHYPIGSQGNHWLVLDKQIESHADSIVFFSWESNASHRHTVEILETDQRSGTLKK